MSPQIIPAVPPLVLVVDDDPDFCSTLSGVLETEGFTVVAVQDGKIALESVRRHSPEVVLLDWNMPEMDGIAILGRILIDPVLAGTYVIMVTARCEASDIVKSMGAGASDFLTKPFHNEELLARVRVGIRARRMQRALAGNVRRTTVAEMAGSIAHEIGNPLTTAKLLHERLKADPKLQSHRDILDELDELGKELARIEEIVRKAQTLSSINSVPYAGDVNIIDLAGLPDDPVSR